MNNNDIFNAITGWSSEFVAIRRDIHRYPELGFEEHRTSTLVANRLSAWGYSVERGLGGTGVVGQLKRGQSQRRLGLRADMDALPITEANDFDHVSHHAGVMHACGHDGHTAMLLAAARYLAEEGKFDGTLNLIFQPAEEGLDGAKRMMEDGLFNKYPCDAIFAMHNMPGVTQGHLLLRDGPAMASSDRVIVVIKGIGGHAAMPHHASDPVVAAASIVMALQTVVSRNVDPQQTAVITVGALNAGDADNVIPQTATLKLSVRALDPNVRNLLEERIKALVHEQAKSFGVDAIVDYKRVNPVLVNTVTETEFARGVALDLVGADRVNLQCRAQTGSEDFAFMLEQLPGSYILIGNGEGDSAGACMLHDPNYEFNDDNLSIGATYWVRLAERYLHNDPQNI